MGIVKRYDKVAFFGVKGADNSYTYYRMTNFTELSISKNPKEYTRQYIDEVMEQTDVVGYSPAVSYAFDCYSGNAVHEDITLISDGEYTGDAAVRPIIMVDITKSADNGIKRDFAVIPDSEGNSTDAYTYSGTFKVKGGKKIVTATSTDDWKTCVIK